MSKMLSTEENLTQINKFCEEAEEAISSDVFLNKLGGLTIFAGVVDFLCIQAARSVEQCVIKYDIANKRKYSFDEGAPHEDNWFYDRRISTRSIIKNIRKWSSSITSHEDIKKHVFDMCESGEEFLNNRNTAIHHVGNPRVSIEKMNESVTDAITEYKKFLKVFFLFQEKIRPFTFSEDERKLLYGDDKSKGVILNVAHL